jgi:hypothetical protein
MKEQLIRTLKKAVDLLAACNLPSRADWFNSRMDVIQSDATSPELFDKTVREIRGIIAGMGSFTDLSLVPSRTSALTEETARRLQWEIADELDEATAGLIKKVS